MRLAYCLLLIAVASGCARSTVQTVADPSAGGPRPAADEVAVGDPDPGWSAAEALAAVLAPSARPADSFEPEPADLGPVVMPLPSVWDRLRAGYAIDFDTHPRVRQHHDWYVGNPDYLYRAAERAEPFLAFILDRIEERGLPSELALLPVVESAYQTFAYSPGRAAGIWQIIPSTGRLLGLRQTWWYDGRRDIVASTGAALTYLERLNEQFDGDWLLTLAAYNAGPGRVREARRYNARRGRPGDFWHLSSLAPETRAYVPKLLALAQVVAEAERHGIDLPLIADEDRLAIVDVGSQIDLALAADLAGLSIEEMYRFNPGFNRWATDPQGPHRIVVPVDRVDAFEAALAEVPPEARIRWVRHRISTGETLSHIARRYGTTVAQVQRSNGLQGHRIRAGDHLVVPTATLAPEGYALSAPQRRAATQSRPREGHRHEYRVQPGDSLWQISRRYGVSVHRLARWNAMAPADTLRTGQTLVIWTDEPVAAPRARLENAGLAPDARITTIRYRVRSGDSLWTIARKFNVDVSDIRNWNRVGKYLQPGQTLTLHVDVTRQSGEI